MERSNMVRGIGAGQWTLYPISFATDASDNPTLVEDFDGAVTIARSTTDYVITLPEPFTFAILVASIGVAGVDFVDGFATNAAAGTVTLETNNGLTSAEAQVLIAAYRNNL